MVRSVISILERLNPKNGGRDSYDRYRFRCFGFYSKGFGTFVTEFSKGCFELNAGHVDK